MKYVSLSVAGVLTVLLVAAPASSADINMRKAASGGAAYYPVDDQCFERLYGRVYADWNSTTCNAQKYWTIDVAVPGVGGNKSFWAVGESEVSVATSTYATTCAAIVLLGNGNLARWTLHQVLPTSAGTKNLGTLTYNLGEMVQFECFISPFGSGATGYVGQVGGTPWYTPFFPG